MEGSNYHRDSDQDRFLLAYCLWFDNMVIVNLLFSKGAPELPHQLLDEGGAGAFLLFGSMAFHELSHSVVARHYKVSIESITLFVFGGVAQMKGEPPYPRAEFLIAIAGPVSSICQSGLFLGSRRLRQVAGKHFSLIWPH